MFGILFAVPIIMFLLLYKEERKRVDVSYWLADPENLELFNNTARACLTDPETGITKPWDPYGKLPHPIGSYRDYDGMRTGDCEELQIRSAVEILQKRDRKFKEYIEKFLEDAEEKKRERGF